ncbi:MAG TPA: DEAD/DEAH box helicase [Longimicrobiales bacterium]
MTAPSTARDVARRILAARFEPGVDRDPADPSPVFELARFQEDAVRRAEQILAARRGVVIADSVGLGKTFIALALIEGALRRGERVAVTTPASLRTAWHAPLRRLAGALALRETYGIPRPPPARVGRRPTAARAPEHAFLAWFSHARLSRGTVPAARTDSLDLVVVDEAHAFRNPGTRRYRALAALCRPARVVLLTATPVNNALPDLYALLRLFVGDDAFRDVGVPDLREAFRTAAGGNGAPPTELHAVLRAVVIRRTRAVLRREYGGARVPGTPHRAPSLPRRAPPVPVRYALDRVYPGFFAEIAETIEALDLAQLSVARRTAGPAPAAVLVRMALLKRLESSIAAFRASINRQVRFHEAFLEALGRGRLLLPADHRALYDGGDDDVAQLVLTAVALDALPPDVDARRLRSRALRDLERLRRIRRKLATLAAEDDPKLCRLRALLDGELHAEKVVVFTEFLDTARYLWSALVPRGGIALVDGQAARLGRMPCTRNAAIARFAPHANHAPAPGPRERVDLLIATDVLAEGLNLQDARCVISYDLPWNPVRLIQRIGRVDRIGTRHATIRSFHFLPDGGLERVLRVRARLRAKLAAIAASVGAEPEVLADAEGTAPLDAVIDRLTAGDPDALEVLEHRTAAPLELEERLRAAYAAECARAERDAATAGHGARSAAGAPNGGVAHGDPIPTGGRAPPAAAIAAPPGAHRRFLLAYDDAGTSIWILVDAETGTAVEDDAAAAELLLDALADGSRPMRPPRRRDIARAVAAAAPRLEARRAIQGAPARIPAGAPAARAARRLAAALRAVPGGPDTDLCRRADAVLAALAHGQSAGTEAAVRHALASTPDGADALRLLTALEHAFDRPDDRASRDRATCRAELVGVLEARPAPPAT